MGKVYAIPDLHGRYDLFLRAIETIENRSQKAQVVFLGDYIDRGPQSYQIIRDLIHGPTSSDYKWYPILGNHEDMAVQCWTGTANMDWWMSNGGHQTIHSYPNHDTITEHVKWFGNLPLTVQIGHRLFVHAGIDPIIPIESQKRDELLWKLYRNDMPRGHDPTGSHVVHGHHQFKNGPKLYSGRTNLDTFAWKTGRLCIGVFDNDIPGGPVEILEILGPPTKTMSF